MTDKLTAEEILLQHFQKEYGMHDDWKLSDFFPDNELKAVFAAMEAYKNQSAVSDVEVKKEAERLFPYNEAVVSAGTGEITKLSKHLVDRRRRDWYNGFKSALSSVSESNVGGMRWVKASERLPQVGVYNALYNGDHVIFQLHDGGFRIVFYDGSVFDEPKLSVLKWLDESIPSEVKEKDLDSGDKQKFLNK